MQGQGGIQSGLTTHRWQQRIRALFGNDFFHHIRGNGLHIGGICHDRVSHNGRWVGIDQNHTVAFFFEGFTGLRA